MVKIEYSLVINRPAEEVFEYLANPEKGLLYQSGVLEAEQTSEDMGVGATFREVRKFLGRRIESTNEVTVYELNEKIGYKSTSGPIPLEVITTLEPFEDGTQISIEAEAETGGLFKLADPVVGRMAKRQMEADFGNLKDLLETQD